MYLIFFARAREKKKVNKECTVLEGMRAIVAHTCPGACFVARYIPILLMRYGYTSTSCSVPVYRCKEGGKVVFVGNVFDPSSGGV
jgi:hypothetical protein